VIIVEYQYSLRCGASLLKWMITCQQVVRGQDAGILVHPYRPWCATARRHRSAIARPVATRMSVNSWPRASSGRDFTLQADVHVAVVPAELPDPVVGDAAPRGQAREISLTGNPSA